MQGTRPKNISKKVIAVPLVFMGMRVKGSGKQASFPGLEEINDFSLFAGATEFHNITHAAF